MEKALNNFLDDSGKLKAFPAKRKMKAFALVFLAEKFESGRVYSEKEVNELLNSYCTFKDPATLRRELYNNRFLDRTPDSASYWLESVQPTVEQLLKKYE